MRTSGLEGKRRNVDECLPRTSVSLSVPMFFSLFSLDRRYEIQLRTLVKFLYHEKSVYHVRTGYFDIENTQPRSRKKRKSEYPRVAHGQNFLSQNNGKKVSGILELWSQESEKINSAIAMPKSGYRRLIFNEKFIEKFRRDLANAVPDFLMRKYVPRDNSSDQTSRVTPFEVLNARTCCRWCKRSSTVGAWMDQWPGTRESLSWMREGMRGHRRRRRRGAAPLFSGSGSPRRYRGWINENAGDTVATRLPTAEDRDRTPCDFATRFLPRRRQSSDSILSLHYPPPAPITPNERTYGRTPVVYSFRDFASLLSTSAQATRCSLPPLHLLEGNSLRDATRRLRGSGRKVLQFPKFSCLLLSIALNGLVVPQTRAVVIFSHASGRIDKWPLFRMTRCLFRGLYRRWWFFE